MLVLKLEEKCKACNGTGLTVEYGVEDGTAVVCGDCKGTGCVKTNYDYEKFTGRADRKGVKRVYSIDPGITLSKNNERRFTSGGMSYDEWKQGKEFTSGIEDRHYTCPAWWYNIEDYKKKPEWDECGHYHGRHFSQCKYFGAKEICWKRWDAESQEREEVNNEKPERQMNNNTATKDRKTADVIESTLNESAPTQKPFTTYPKGRFQAELEELINKHCIECGSDTPDFILAEYLKQCLETFDLCVRRREKWYGRYV